MSKPVVEVHVRAVLPTSGGWAVFLGNGGKVFVIYVDQSVGVAIVMSLMATQHRAPIYVSGEVWEEVEDMAEVLRKIEEEGSEFGESG